MDQQQTNNPAPPPSSPPQPGGMPPQPGMPPTGAPMGQQQMPGGYQPRGTNTMAIIALVVTFIFPLIGLVLGIIALSQIKKSGEDGKILAIVAIVINVLQVLLFIFWIVVVIVIFANTDLELDDIQNDFESVEIETDQRDDVTDFQSQQSAAARDVERKTDIQFIRSQLEAHYAQYGFYPDEATVQTLPAIDPEALEDPSSGAPYTYLPTPIGCSDQCDSYTLSAQLEDGTTYTEEALN